MIPLEAVELKQQDLKQAIAIEKQHRYTDVQGKKQRFSQFLVKELEALSPFLGNLDSKEGLLNASRQYAFMDLAGRMRFLDKLVEALSQPNQKLPYTRHPQDPMETDVQYVKGVGPRIGDILHKVGVLTVWNLLHYFPRKYLDYNQRLKIVSLTIGQEATVIGRIRQVNAHITKNKQMAIITVKIADETGELLANWILGKANRRMLEAYKARYTIGAEVMASGRVKWDEYKRRLAMDRPEVEILSYGADDPDMPQSLHSGRIVPVYPLVEGLNLKALRRAIRHALDEYLSGVADPLPLDIRKQYRLLDLQTALEQIHFPQTFSHYESARNRLVFDELFAMQLKLAMIRNEYKSHASGLSLKTEPEGLVERFLTQLPFRLTNAQQRVFQEIARDMGSSEPMYRLLQGDVGSGKTILALLTLLTAIENGYQGVLMAPTEILAEQHYRNCVSWLTPLGLKAGLFIGRSGAKERRELRQGLLNGQIHLAVGTHALIQDGVEFNRLGAIVVDEQHRFGVRQRIQLKDKGENPEMLTMTATPIPRTLAMTLHGDLDVSILDELPPGRTPIKTFLFQGKARQEEAFGLIRQEIFKGRQAYIVFPLIEESDKFSAKAATVEYERLANEVFPHLRVGLLHGKMASSEKDSVMKAFIHHQLDILVSTTVIEVGVDVPNATVMLVESADRFGLAQLHQLRGRVGRGSQQSYCLLLSDSRTPETLARLRILEESTDGFLIAEKDLELRGPGEFLGTRQSGLPDLILADLIQDRSILEMAREAAIVLVEKGLHTEFLQYNPGNSFSVFSSG